jgi:hypothetical protein
MAGKVMTVLLIRRIDIGYDHNPTTRDALVGIVNSTWAFLSYRDERRRRNNAANRKMGAA